MLPGVFAPSMFPSSGSYQHGPPLLLRLREPPLLGLLAPMQPPDFLPTFGLSSGYPRSRPTSLSRRVNRTSQVTGPSPSRAPRSSTTPGVPYPRRPCGHGTAAFREVRLLGTWKNISFVAVPPAARTLVDLRIAAAVTRNRARPYFRPARLSFGRVGFTHWTTNLNF